VAKSAEDRELEIHITIEWEEDEPVQPPSQLEYAAIKATETLHNWVLFGFLVFFFSLIGTLFT